MLPRWNPYRGDDGPTPPDAADARLVPGTDQPRPSGEPRWVSEPRWSREWPLDGPEGSVVMTRLYTISALAAALGKSPHTIRQWTRTGIIPDSGWRTPEVHTGALSSRGRRLWTREQIEALVACARSEGMLGSSRVTSFSTSRFQDKVDGLWRRHNW